MFVISNVYSKNEGSKPSKPEDTMYKSDATTALETAGLSWGSPRQDVVMVLTAAIRSLPGAAPESAHLTAEMMADKYCEQ